MISSIIVAGGRGLRMQNRTPKQYLQLDGIPILARTLRVFNDCHAVEQILLVVPKKDFGFVRENIISFLNPKKKIKLVPGGEQRQDSVYNALSELNDESSIVVVHDGVRPKRYQRLSTGG